MKKKKVELAVNLKSVTIFVGYRESALGRDFCRAARCSLGETGALS
jgi:hypothetical protein